MQPVQIGTRSVGPDEPTFIVAEIGINHNGSVETARQLIDVAVECGCDAVKFQKRTVDVVYTKEELAQPRESPLGLTNGELKYGLEFGSHEYEAIDEYCQKRGIMWFASPWDEGSVDFLEQFNPPCYKIASPSLTDDDLLRHIRSKGRPIILSTGMSDLPMIEHAVEVLGHDNLVLMHCTSFYPTIETRENHGLSMLNLRGIETIRHHFNVPVGYSSHDTGIMPTYAAVVMGAAMVEKHITLYRAMWGSDQAASIEPDDVRKLCRMIREFPHARGDGTIKVYDEELPIMQKLRRKHGVWANKFAS